MVKFSPYINFRTLFNKDKEDVPKGFEKFARKVADKKPKEKEEKEAKKEEKQAEVSDEEEAETGGHRKGQDEPNDF